MINYLKIVLLTSLIILLMSCSANDQTPMVTLAHGEDESAGGDSSYIITTLSATYYLEKQGGGLSSILDNDGVDWLGFHNKKGSGHKGEYRGFPNAIHKQDGNYFHAMNAGTDKSTSNVEIIAPNHIRIVFTSGNGQWQGQWDFYPSRCDFTMREVSQGYNYWIQYEGVPNGQMDKNDFWFASADNKKHAITEHYVGDLPSPEWMAFGDEKSPRMLYMLHHQDDDLPDNYEDRADMTVFAFGRSNKNKYLATPSRFSIGFIESVDYKTVSEHIIKQLD